MIELRRRHYPDPWGRSSLGEQEALETISLKEIRGFFQRQFQPRGTILGVAGRLEWKPLEGACRHALGRLAAGRWRAFDEQPAQGGTCTCPAIRPRRTSASPTRACRIAIATISRPGAPWGPGGGMSSRLFTEVRERRGLCYSVYASYHTLRDRAGVFCYAGSSAQRAQETLDVTRAN